MLSGKTGKPAICWSSAGEAPVLSRFSASRRLWSLSAAPHSVVKAAHTIRHLQSWVGMVRTHRPWLCLSWPISNRPESQGLARCSLENTTHALNWQHKAQGLASATLWEDKPTESVARGVLPSCNSTKALVGKPSRCLVLTQKLSKHWNRTDHVKCQDIWQQDSIHTDAPWKSSRSQGSLFQQ